jgi:hypothetical protein
MRYVLFLLCLGTFARAADCQSPQKQGLRVHDSTLVLADGRSFVPGLYQLRAHAVLGKSLRPFLVLSGFGCDDCDAVRSVYLLRFGERLDWNKQPWPPVFAYPGTTNDTDNQPIARSRLFYGQCGADSSYLVIQFAHTQGRGSTWADSTHIAELRGDSIITKSSGYNRSSLDLALAQVGKSVCHEIPGRLQVEP